jgi:immunity protein 52 of polymorphic toxin system
LLDFPSDTSAFTGLMEPVALNKIMASAVLAFDPDWAIITSIDHLNKVRADRSNGPFAGWISYFKQLGRQEAERLPSIRRELLSSDHPVILTLAQDGFASSISSHVDAADRVTQNLRQHNII